MFGFSPKLFNPMNSGQGKGAVFAGSWYANQTDRCQDTEECFEMIIKKGIPLTIYDRHSRSANPNNRFPEKYTSLINNCIEFSKLGDVLKQFRYAININTIKDSQTMFARRVFELMACNTVVISNESIGLRQLFNSNVWFVNDDFDRNSLSRICNENLIEVFKNHTCNQRLRYLLKNVQINFCEDNGNVVILYDGTANDTDECRLHYRGLPYEQKCGFIHEDYAFRKLSDDSILTKQQFLSESSFFGYFIMADSTSPSNMDIDYALKHFEYIEEATGIREGEHIYCYINDSHNLNTLFEIGILESLLENKNRMLKKYLI
jgi:hypothetical protein